MKPMLEWGGPLACWLDHTHWTPSMPPAPRPSLRHASLTSGLHTLPASLRMRRCRHSCPRRSILHTVVDLLLLLRKPILCMLIQDAFVRQHDIHILRVLCELQPLLLKLNLSKCLGLLELPFDHRLLLLQLDLLP